MMVEKDMIQLDFVTNVEISEIIVDHLSLVALRNVVRCNEYIEINLWKISCVFGTPY